ncbi:MAG: quinone-dependent dihydroorotate dehydrogenase [Chitinophagaceae bacterium]|nr:quinone-dependent dihydroorotate dehydrogenase [Chitinophagaceae bacterium]
MYRLLRNILFWFSPEWVHYFSMNGLRLLCSIGLKKLIANIHKPKGNTQYSIFNIHFSNRIGLGAGFDKNAKYLRELESLGFGFVEIGTVTPLPQAGNEKPRLFRLPKDKALINRMGFNNDGVKVVAERLKKWNNSSDPIAIGFGVRSRGSEAIDSRLMTKDSRLIIGGNIGKNKSTPNEEAWKDYEICFKELYPYVDYFVVNVSSPNTPGLRELQEKDSLKKILTKLQAINQQQTTSNQKPILLKIAPDLTTEQLDDVIDLALEIKLDGLVATNTTISRSGLLTPDSRLNSFGAGGLSGLPLKQKSTEIVKYISERTKGQIPVIASGGIFTGEDAKEKIAAGASLVQVWTGFIYEGPGIVKQICKSL